MSENQFVVDDAANVMRRYAAKGYDLIIAHGSQYGGTVEQLAPKYPEGLLRLGHCRRDLRAPERLRVSGEFERRWVRAGRHGSDCSARSKVIGVIGPIAVGDAKLYVDGFKAGALATNPEGTVRVGYTGSFSDPA